MRGTATYSGNSSFAFELDRLPATRVEAGTRGAGIFLIVFAAFWGGVPAVATVTAIRSGTFKPEMLITLLFTVIGAGLFVLGIHFLKYRREITITDDRVTVRKRGLRGWQAWSTPLAEYPGVISRTEHHSGGKNRPSYTLFIVELHHADRKRVVRLYQSRSDAGFRAHWEQYCRQLNKPALALDGSAMVRREVSDLDTPVRELVRQGKLAADFDASRPPTGLALRVDGDVLELTVTRHPSLWGFLIASCIPAVFIYVGFFIPEGPLLFGMVGIFILVVGLIAAVWSQLAHEQIRISRAVVQTRTVTRWNTTAGATIPAERIEMVRVGRREAGGRESVLIETDDGITAFGAALPPAAMGWVRDCVLKVLST